VNDRPRGQPTLLAQQRFDDAGNEWDADTLFNIDTFLWTSGTTDARLVWRRFSDTMVERLAFSVGEVVSRTSRTMSRPIFVVAALVTLLGCSTGAQPSLPADPGLPEESGGPLATASAPDVEAPLDTLPPGFSFPPLPDRLTRGDVVIFANKLLYERTGKICVQQNFEEPAMRPDWDAMAADLPGGEGLLEDGRTYIGDLSGALRAFGLERTGLKLPGLAYGIGRVPKERALPHLPEGTWWLPEFAQITLSDGRTGWTWTGAYFASHPTCEVDS